MEPGDLRINSRLRDDSGVPKGSPNAAAYAAAEGNSVLHFRNHNIRPAIVSDHRMHHVPTSIPGNSMVLDRYARSRNEPVKIWRDPNLMNSGEVRHVVSMQHSGVVHLSHPMMAHANVNPSGSVYQQHHDNKPLDATSRGPSISTTDVLRGRAPIMYAPPPHPPPPSNPKPPMDAWRPSVVQNPKDVRVCLTGKSTVEQAVHDHFVESLRLAHLKGSTVVQAPVKQEEANPHLSAQMQRFYPPPHDKRHHVELPSPQVIYQIHQHQQALSKAELPAPPPLKSEPQYRTGGVVGPPEGSRKQQHQIYGAPEVMGRTAHPETPQQSSIRYEQEPVSSRLDVHPSESVRYQKLPPAPSPRHRTTPQNDLQQIERNNRSPFGKQQAPPVASPNSYHLYPQAHLSSSGKHKVVVNSPAPTHMYGKPGSSGRPYDMMTDPFAPLSLTSKGGLTRPSQSSPTPYAHAHTSPTLPQHDVRKSDVAYYMYNNAPPGYQPPHTVSPQAHIHAAAAAAHAIQTQPLDLGGKRKHEEAAEVYKGPIPEYSDQNLVKSFYGSRNKPPLEESRQKSMSHNHPNHHHPSNPIPLSLTVAEASSKRKIEDSPPMPLHLDTKKVRSDTSVISSTNVIMRGGNKDHHSELTMKATTMSESLLPTTKVTLPPRSQFSDSIAPPAHVSLIASGSDTARVKPNITQQAPLPLDIKQLQQQSSAKIGAELDTQPSGIINTAAVSVVTRVCNGKLKEDTAADHIALPEQKLEPERTVAAAAATTEPKTEAATASVSAMPATTPSTSVSTKFQKVPKKAWVLQWHEGDGMEKTIEEPLTNSEAAKNKTGSSDVQNNKGLTTEDCNTSSSDKDKVVNGSVASSTSGDKEGKSHVTIAGTPSATSQSVNGFGKERLNDNSDIGSENESDNNGKEKVLTDNGVSPMKKNGRKGKEGNRQSSPKPDLRKDGLCKRPPVTQLKKTGESFIQAETCNRVTPKIGKCRECRWHPSARGSKKQSGAYCRFYGFRKLRYTKGGSLTVAGFSDPFTDPAKITEHDQFRLWLPSSSLSDSAPNGLDLEISKFLLSQLCQPFCDLVQQEEEARRLASSQELSVIAWKPLLKGVREMCDVCDTTLFNFHWACAKCGFVVCLTCFKTRKSESDQEKAAEITGKDRDEFQWLLCSNRCAHELDKLILVQTIAGDALNDLNERLHKLCATWEIPLDCECKEKLTTDDTKPKEIDAATDSKKSDSESCPEKGDTKNESQKEEGNENTSSDKKSPAEELNLDSKKGQENEDCSLTKKEGSKGKDSIRNLSNYIKSSYEKIKRKRSLLQLTSFSKTESVNQFPSVKHSWLCNGRLLRLLEPESSENFAIFHELWKRGQPVLVSNVTDKLDKTLWTPESFSKDFGDYKNDFVNWTTGSVVANQQLKKFWEGFSSISKRMKDDEGEPMLLKLKDWPPSDDFAQTLPTRFQDLTNALPLPDYTLRNGKRNMAARLPPEFMRPDLGPKMYVAYGSSSIEEKGTTNLHSYVSDAVNLLVYCERPQDIDLGEHNKAIRQAVEESDFDSVTQERVLQNKEVPGAIWHLYEAKDADTIRSFLNKVATEKDGKCEKGQDAIFDQSCYLDTKLRKRLQAEYNISGYAILQCVGDAIFIPAGAPHQVYNLQNCINVAEDFISPENISHSFYLSEEEFHNLSESHSNREDKLQIKNIVYHSVKDAITVLLLHNSEKSENNSSNQTIDTSTTTTALSKDCQRSTSPG